MSENQSIPGICETRSFADPRCEPSMVPSLLIELPHGATLREHFEATRRQLDGSLPDDLIDFFFVNTDVGAPECAMEIARQIVESACSSSHGLKVQVVRSLIPRTFIDCNRVIDLAPSKDRSRGPDEQAGPRPGMTPGLPEYINVERDAPKLLAMYAAYHEVADRAFETVCASGGLALTLHTYAPRSIRIDRFDDGIVAALRRAYRPQTYATWPERPDVDLITETTDGRDLAPPGAVAALRRAYSEIGVRTAENATYRLHPDSMGYRYSDRFPGQVLCVEINRALLADPFAPFSEMHIGEPQAVRMSSPLASVLRDRILAGR